jgi:Family of unknown function (DUF6350)
VGAALGIAVAVACWLPIAGTAGRPASAIRAGGLAFLAAQHGGIDLDGTRVGLVPLACTAVVALVVWRAAAVLADVLERHRQTSAGRITFGAAVFAAGYAAVCSGLALITPLGTTSVPILRVTLAALVVGAVVGGASLAWAGGQRGWWHRPLPDAARPGLRAASGALVVYVGAGAVLGAGSLVVHAGEVTQLSRMVGGGASGVPLIVLGVLCVPNAAVAGAAYLAGPGFTVGSGTTVSAFAASHGTLPAFPLLGAVPTGRGAPAPVLALLVATLLAAGWITVRLAQAGQAPAWGDMVRRVAVAAATAGAGMAALAALAGGGAGPNRLAVIGPSPWQAGVTVAGEIAVTSLVVLAGSSAWRWLALRVAVVDPEPDDTDAAEDNEAALSG